MPIHSSYNEILHEYSGKTIAELRYILSNKKSYTEDQLKAAIQLIEKKRTEWKKRNSDMTRKIDALIRKETWFDFHVLSYDGYKLTVGGSIDLTYYHTLELIFEDVFFVSGFFNGWRSDTGQAVFQIPDNEIELNNKFEIEEDYQLFVFRSEDYQNDIYIAANTISFNTDTVFYYERQNLKSNERIADFVKSKKDE